MFSHRSVRLRRRGVEVVTILASFLFVVGCDSAPGERGGTSTGAAGRSEHAPAEGNLAHEIVVAKEELGSAEAVARSVTAAPQDAPPKKAPEGQSPEPNVAAPEKEAGSAEPVARGATATSRDERAGRAPTNEGGEAGIAVREKEPGPAEETGKRATSTPQDTHSGQAPADQGLERRIPVPEKKALPVEPVVLTDASFRKLTQDGVVLVDFWAPWCSWCRRLAPIIDKLAVEYAGKAVVAKLNTDENPETPARYAVRGLPTVIVLREGRLVAKLEGFRPEKSLRSALDAALAEE